MVCLTILPPLGFLPLFLGIFGTAKLSLSCKTTFSSKTCVIGLVTVFSVFLALFFSTTTFSTTTFSNEIFIFKNKVINLNSFIKYLNRYYSILFNII